MNALEGFIPFNFEEGVPYVSVTMNGVTFNKSVVLKLGRPTHVLLLINEAEKKIAVQACESGTPSATSFYKEKKSGVISVRWNGKDLLNTFEDMTGWNLKNEAYRIEGVHFKTEKAIVFDLAQALPL